MTECSFACDPDHLWCRIYSDFLLISRGAAAGGRFAPAAKFGKLGTVKIATWNVNSLRARADRVEAWLQRTDCDVLAIQETKCKDDNFPWELFETHGLRGGAFRPEPVERRGHRLPGGARRRRTHLPGPARIRQGRQGCRAGSPRHRRHLRRRPGLEPLCPQRPRPRRRAHAVQAQLAGHAEGPRRRLGRGGPARADRADGRLEHRPAGRGRLGHRLLPRRGPHPRQRARARRLPRL